MKILAIQPFADAAGHYGKYAARICQDICNLGHQVVLCTNNIEIEKYLTEEPAFQVVSLGSEYSFVKYDVRRSSYQLYWLLGRIKNNLAVLRFAVRLTNQEHFDSVQLFSYELASTWLFLSLFRSASLNPIVIEIAAPNFSAEEYYGGPPEVLWRRIQKFALKQMLRSRIGAINVYGDSHAIELIKQLDLPDDFIIGVTGDSRKIPEIRIDKHEARKTIGLSDYRDQLFLFFGTLRRDKGLDTLFRAIRLLKEEDFKVVIAGMPVDWRAPEDDILLDNHLLTRFEYIPEDQVDAYFCASDALILPYSSHYIGSSGPLFDACAYGLPVIASNVSEMGNIIKERELGLVVPPEDSQALADAIKRFIHLAPNEKAKLSMNALNAVREKTNVNVAQNYVNLYERVVEKLA